MIYRLYCHTLIVIFIGCVVYFVIVPVDNSGRKGQRNKKEHFFLLEETSLNVCGCFFHWFSI